MPYYKFEPDDIFYNRLKAHPQNSFYIYDERIYYNNRGYVAGAHTINAGMVPVGYVSLYELNIDRPATDKIYPFITKDGSLTAFRTTTNKQFNTDFMFGDIITGSYPMSASLSSERYAQDQTRKRIKALRNSLDSYKIWSPAYSYNSDLGDKSTQELRLISIPSIFYGSSIEKGTVSLQFYITGALIGELKDDLRNGELRQVHNTTGTVALSDLYAFYKFDQTLADNDWDKTDSLLDSSGNGYNATPQENNIYQVPGKFKKAVGFAEITEEQYFENTSIPITGSLTAGGGFSVSCWVKQAKVDPVVYPDPITIVACDGASSVYWRLYYDTWNSTNARFQIMDVDGNIAIFTSSAPSPVDEWIHLVGTYTSGQDPNLYIDGELLSTAGIATRIDSGGLPIPASSLGELKDDAATLFIGGGFDTGDYMSGSLDDLRLYKKVLSAPQVEAIYSASSGAGSEVLTSGASSGSVAGVVMYNEGFIILTGSWDLAEKTNDIYIAGHPSGTPSRPRWIDFGSTGSDALNENMPSSSFALDFSGTNYIPTLTMFAHATPGELNYSNNPTSVQFNKTQIQPAQTGSTMYTQPIKNVIKNVGSSSFSATMPPYRKTVFINQVGIYDKDKNLIAIAKTSSPVRKRDVDDYTFKLKLDF